jgi:hypothetical protein
MINNQFSRRNLPIEERLRLAFADTDLEELQAEANERKWSGEKIDLSEPVHTGQQKGCTLMIWMVENQMARRNLTKAAYLSLEDTRRRIMAKQAKENQKRKPIDKDSVALISGRQNKEDRSGRADRQMSKITGIAHGTVAKYNYVRDKILWLG